VNRLNHLLEAFSEQNLLLQMLLGVLSETERVARLLPKPVGDSVTPSTEMSVDPFTAALLGIVSLHAELRNAALEKSSGGHRPGNARHRVFKKPSVSGREPTIRELMR
jgi:hypothetical protein